jgi:uncharacterized protein Smg (DUF494 family)
MRSRVFEIVVFLIDYLQGDASRLGETDDIWTALEAQGYSEEDISSAYNWLLKRVDHFPREYFSHFPEQSQSVRVFTTDERDRLTSEAQNFLLQMARFGAIDREQLEAVLDRTTLYVNRPVELDQIKAIAASVIFSEIDEDDIPSVFDADEDVMETAH